MAKQTTKTPARGKQTAAPAPAQRRQAPAAPTREQAPRSAAQTAVAERRSTAVGQPSALASRMSQDTNKGVSKSSEDNLVPLIYILQALSPQVNSRNQEYIEGAEPGMVWLRNNPVPLVDGENEGIVVQPCFFSKVYNEWIPRDAGGGFVARHAELPDGAEKVEDPKNPRRPKWMLGDNELIETREHTVRVFHNGAWFPYVIPMTGTNHSASRGWMFMMNGKLINGETAPSWGSLYRLKTKFQKNDRGEWFNWTVEDLGWIDVALAELDPEADAVREYEEGSKIYHGFASGEKQVDSGQYEDIDEGVVDDGDGDGDERP